jgi:hypothetical protein
MPTRVTTEEVKWEIQQAITEAKKKEQAEVVNALAKIVAFINKPKPLYENQH